MSHPEQWLHDALTAHQCGDLQTAKTLYERIIAHTPQHADALHLLGVVAHQEGQHLLAEGYICRAIALNPRVPAFFNNQGLVLQAQGKSQAAMDSYGQALRLQPDFADAAYNLGRAQRACGQLDAAAASLRLALHLQPDFAEAHHNLGNVLGVQGQWNEAVACFKQALCIRPHDAEVHYNLGNAWRALGQMECAKASYHQAVVLRPDFAAAHNNLGTVYQALGQWDAAIRSFDRTLTLNPNVAETHHNLGHVRHDQGHLDVAVAHYERALALQPDYAEAHNNLGNTLKELGQLDAALTRFERALTLRPDFGEAHWNRALLWLQQGNLSQGWPAYDWRERKDPGRPPLCPRPRWDGSSLHGCMVMVHAEQGIGDELMFASCLPDLIAQADHCTLTCDARLVSLLARSFPTATIHSRRPRGDHTWIERLPHSDVHIPMGSLPRYLRPTLDCFPARGGYLLPDPERQAKWAQRLDKLGPGLNVGMAWRSRASRQAHRYYTQLTDWEPILTVPGVHLINLQYDSPEAELEAVQARLGVTIHTWDDLDLFNDFEGVAALVAALDLVIAPEMTTAALAGSVGTQVWQLMTYPGSWPMLGTDRQPWFPTMRVFQQLHLNVWDEVIRRVADALRELPHTAYMPGSLIERVG